MGLWPSRRTARIGVPAVVRSYPAHSSPARIWANALSRLDRRARIVVGDPGGGRRVDVWLTDGHQGPLAVDAPVVALLLEAAWTDPEVRPLLEPGFLAAYEGPSAAAAVAATRIITVSRSSRDQIVEAYGIAEADVVVAPIGIDHAVYRPGRRGAADLVARAGGDPAVPYVLFVSTVHPRKNLAALREAVGMVNAKGHAVALVLVAGPAPDRADSAELAAAAVAPIAGVPGPVVNLAGISDADVARLMAGARAVCQPSLMEGFGMAVAEAMACGATVVVADRGSLPEVVGAAGIVVEPTASALAGGLAVALGEPPEVAADRRRRSIDQAARFTWDDMVERWWEAIDAALDHP